MFDVVAPYQHQPPAAIHGGGVDHSQPGHPPAIGVGADAVAGESPYQPGGEADQRQNGDEGEQEPKCLRHATSPANKAFFKFPFRRARTESDPSNGERSPRSALLLNSPRQVLPPTHSNKPRIA